MGNSITPGLGPAVSPAPSFERKPSQATDAAQAATPTTPTASATSTNALLSRARSGFEAQTAFPRDYGKLGNADLAFGALPPSQKAASRDSFAMWSTARALLNTAEFRTPTGATQTAATDEVDLVASLNPNQAVKAAIFGGEGQFPRAPSLTRSRFGNTRLGQLISAYQSAPSYQGKDETFRRANPNIGWEHLVTVGQLRRETVDALAAAGNANYMQFVPENSE